MTHTPTVHAADIDPIRTSDAALLARRPAATIRAWAYRGWIRRVGSAGRQATWNRTDVLTAEAALAAGRVPPVVRPDRAAQQTSP